MIILIIRVGSGEWGVGSGEWGDKGFEFGSKGKGFWVKDKKEEIFSLSPGLFHPDPFLLPNAQCPMPN
jgi:hypothetical protein